MLYYFFLLTDVALEESFEENDEDFNYMADAEIDDHEIIKEEFRNDKAVKITRELYSKQLLSYHIYYLIISYLWLTSHPRNTYALQGTRTPGICRANAIRIHRVRLKVAAS